MYHNLYKRIAAVLLLTTLLLSLLAGCGTDTPGKDPQSKDPQTPTAEAPQITLDPLTGDQALEKVITRGPDGTQTATEYTILLYLVGSDLESDSGCATLDMEEIRRSGLDTSRVNLLVYTGGSRYWHSDVPSDCNVVYRLRDGSWDAVAATATANNMGDPSVFLDFLGYACQNYPAAHYGLICWDHGAGPLGGVCYDELYNNDSLHLLELEAALAASPFASQKLDFLGFDACLMANWETAQIASPYANYLIASEETEPGGGWDYSFLGALNDSSDTRSLARTILYTYEASMSGYTRTPDYTLSCLDLSKLSGFQQAADALFEKMADGVKDGSYSRIAQARNETLRFCEGAKSPYDLVDLGHMAQQLSGLYGSEAKALQSQLSQLVMDQVSNVDGTSGLAVYYPYDNKSTYEAAGSYYYTYMTKCDGYERFVASFTDYWINGEPEADFSEHEVQQPALTTPTEPAPTEPTGSAPAAPAPEQQVPSVTDTGSGLQLSAEQLASLSSVTYTVFSGQTDASSGQTVYIPVLSQVPLEPDSSGNVRLPENPSLVVLRTDEESEGILWPASRIYSTGGVHYISNDACLTATLDTVDGLENFSIRFAEGNTSRMNILSLTTQGTSAAAGRAEPDLDRWEYIACRYTTLFPTCNNAGVLTAYTSWDDSGDEYYSLLSYSQEFWLEQVPMDQLEGDFYCQIVLTDTQGNTYGSQLSRFPKSQAYTQLTQDGIVYNVYADHAEVADYTGTNGNVIVADSVSGKPVTAIAAEAFYYSRDVISVTLPSSLETIGARAFANCRNLSSVILPSSLKTIHSEAFRRTALIGIYLPEGLQRIEYSAFADCTNLGAINIPASVSYLGSGVFAGCQNLVGITVALDPNGRSASFRAVDGILLTADGKELVQAPLCAGRTLTVPAGVEIIRSSAVRGSQTLQEVIFPDTLKQIGSYAFYDTVNLTSLDLPDSLQTIGHSAFGTFSVSLNESSPVTSVTIGPNVSYIGYNAFDAFPISAFHVSSQNAHYSAKNGCLLNKSGTVFIHAPYTLQGTLTIPQGVSHLDFHCLYKCDGITGLILPDSVVSMDENIGLPDSLQSLQVGSGLKCWDNIADVCHIPQVTVSDTNPHFVMYGGCIYSRDLTVLYAIDPSAATLAVPEGVTTIADGALAPASAANQTLTHLTLPSTVTYLSGEMFQNLPALQSVEVAAGNASYASHDGMVYTKNGVSLILCPQGKTGTVTVKDGTATIWRYAFYGQLQAERIILPAGLATIRQGNFVSYRSTPLTLELPASLEKIYPDMFRSPARYSVICPAGSTADTFARSRGVEVTN